MEGRKIKAMFVNGGFRKNKNTAQMLQKAMEGAKAAGAEVELVHLYDINLKGCKSCFVCKMKNNKTDGVCAIRDDLRPILERAREADIIVIGSPIYFGRPTGATYSFMERLLFPTYSYHYVDGKSQVLMSNQKKTAMIFTMNCPKEMIKDVKYDIVLGQTVDEMKSVLGHCECVCAYNTYQFDDYSRYDVTLFDEGKKREYRDENFSKDLQNAFDLGKHLVEEVKKE